MNNMIKLGLGALTASLLLSGCAVDEFARKYSPGNVGNMINKSLSGKNVDNFKKEFRDTYLANQFAKFYDKEGYSFDYSRNSIKIQKQLVYFSENVYLRDAFSYVRNNAAETNLTKLYKKSILDRGNTYKVYTGKFNKKVTSIAYGIERLPDFRKSTMRHLKWDLVPLVVEYDKNNKLISLMLTDVEIGAAYDQVNNPNVQSEIELTSLLYIDNALNPIKNNISKKEWEDNLISEHSK